MSHAAEPLLQELVTETGLADATSGALLLLLLLDTYRGFSARMNRAFAA